MVQLRNGNLHRGGKRPGGLGLSRLRLQIFAVLSNEMMAKKSLWSCPKTYRHVSRRRMKCFTVARDSEAEAVS